MPNTAELTRKETVKDFLNLLISGRIDEAYAKYVDMRGKHHNLYFAAGFPSLRQAMLDNHQEFPDKQIDIKRVLAEGDVVVTHSPVTLNPGNKNFTAVHIFRFAGGRIVEMWDVGQEMIPDSPNADGIF